MSVETPFRTTVTVVGMTCGHCTSSVQEEVGEVAGVRSVDVDLASGAVTVTADREITRAEIEAAVVEAGYSLA
ncbi:cation transporter [Pseudonocardia kujensis]|uniref:heavy-metal-associated domain-containing protein n=1 Tax=Pseudonocardia kujensis TaxID=1128675 RepID=UPI001E616BDD|nr:cation transporter [Pseudonocardia kujensis]MCE0767182.1 cation transporter [Pseudonocardia kujensis]